jgi:fucose permease
LLASLVNQIPNNTFSATTSIVEKLFGTPDILISLNFLFFPIAHLAFALPVNWTLTKKGIRFSYFIASAVMVTGVWLRVTISSDNPYVCLLGSLLSGGSGLILLSSSSKITLNWFRPEYITYVTFLCVLCNYCSSSIGLFLPGLLLNSNSSQDDYYSYLRL